MTYTVHGGSSNLVWTDYCLLKEEESSSHIGRGREVGPHLNQQFGKPTCRYFDSVMNEKKPACICTHSCTNTHAFTNTHLLLYTHAYILMHTFIHMYNINFSQMLYQHR